ncbi:MAG: CopG family ribbon-helix-helix protein [Desulfobulbaceae bacterium]|nr:CopG family ribbon-helix-helix protein [Desulfobulbaceae bacterium]
MTTTTMSVRLPGELSRELDLLAKATKRSKSFCAVEAIKNYVKQEAWQIKAIEEGLEDAENRQLVNHSEVKNWVESWGTNAESRPPQCK